MSKPIIVLGGGGHARVLIDCLKQLQLKIIGLTEPDKNKKGLLISGISVLGDDNIVLQYQTSEICLVNGLGSIKKTSKRKQLFEHFKDRGYGFANIIHPSAVIAFDVELKEGVQIMAGAVVQTGSVIADNTIINTRSSVDHDCIIGAHVHIAPGVTLSGDVRVETGVHIGTGAVVIQGVSIGENTVIGAGAVVLEDVPGGVMVVGVPAREVIPK